VHDGRPSSNATTASVARSRKALVCRVIKPAGLQLLAAENHTDRTNADCPPSAASRTKRGTHLPEAARKPTIDAQEARTYRVPVFIASPVTVLLGRLLRFRAISEPRVSLPRGPRGKRPRAGLLFSSPAPVIRQQNVFAGGTLRRMCVRERTRASSGGMIRPALTPPRKHGCSAWEGALELAPPVRGGQSFPILGVVRLGR
jgi:hypothetical protein